MVLFSKLNCMQNKWLLNLFSLSVLSGSNVHFKHCLHLSLKNFKPFANIMFDDKNALSNNINLAVIHLLSLKLACMAVCDKSKAKEYSDEYIMPCFCWLKTFICESQITWIFCCQDANFLNTITWSTFASRLDLQLALTKYIEPYNWWVIPLL